MSLLDWQVLLLVVMPVLPLVAAGVLLRHWRMDSVSLRERALIAVRDWLVASAAGLLALARMGAIQIDAETSLVILATALLLVSLPSAYWLLLYFRGGFERQG